MSSSVPTNKDYNKITAYFLSFIGVVLFVYILKSLSSIIIPFVIAAFLALMLDPVVVYLTKKKLKRWMAIVLICIAVFTIIYLVGLLIYATVSQLPSQNVNYFDQLNKSITDFQAWIDGFVASSAQKMGIREVPKFNLQESIKPFLSIEAVGSSVTTFSTFLINTVIVITVWLFMISGKPEFEEKLFYAFSKKGQGIENTVETTISQMQSYMFMQTLINLGNAVVSVILFYAYGIPLAALWGFLVFILNYIPNVGPVIAVIPPIILSLVMYGFSFVSISFIIIIIVIQFVEGNVIVPKLMGTSMDLSPVYVMISIFFWGYVWGIVGAFLAVPIASIIKIIVSNITPLKPFGLLLCARPKPGKKSR